MNQHLSEINEIIEICNQMIYYIKKYGIIRANNEFYCTYKEKISSFLEENKLEIDDYAPFAVLKALYFKGTSYTVSMSEANMIRDAVINIKHDHFSDFYDNVFISHREKDREHVSAFIELLYAIGIPRPTVDTLESAIFCSSHPDCYIKNGEPNLDKIKEQFNSHKHTFFILWYTDNYFESQACLNEAGAIWANGKYYQEILEPKFDSSKIGGLLDKQPVWFRANDKYRLNTFKEQIQEMFSISLVTQNAWEQARDSFISKLQVYDIG